MDSLAGYIATGIGSLTVGVLSKYLEPKAKLVYWLPHTFFFHLKAENVALQTNSLTIQNLGRRAAEDIEIIHRERPEFFQFSPPLEFEEQISPAGEFVLKIRYLGPKEWFTLQLLNYKTVPYLLNVRSREGVAKQINIVLQRVFPRWVHILYGSLTLIGLGFALYWLVHAAEFLSHQIGIS